MTYMSFFLCALLFMLPCRFIYGADWYSSNAAGIAIGTALSEEAAKQNRYSLSIQRMGASSLPPEMQNYYSDQYSIELHTLFENGSEYKRSWQCLDRQQTLRLVGAVSDTKDGSIDSIEVYDESGMLITELYFMQGDERRISYYYSRHVLIRVETSLNDMPISTDYYRYSRSSSLRYIERLYHNDLDHASRLSFIYKGGVLDYRFDSSVNTINSTFLSDVLISGLSGGRSLFTNDEQKRIIKEEIYDADGNIRGVLENVWDGNRIKTVFFHAQDDERRTDYEYDEDGNREAELNYRNGVLERTMRRDPNNAGLEIEELYYKGDVVLRAIWEQGRKISETGTPVAGRSVP